MNKYQEALELLKEYRIGEELSIVDKVNYNARLEKIIDLLQELVDKETPLNLPLHHGVYMQCKCEAMNEVHSNYCWNCGQKL